MNGAHGSQANWPKSKRVRKSCARVRKNSEPILKPAFTELNARSRSLTTTCSRSMQTYATWKCGSRNSNLSRSRRAESQRLQSGRAIIGTIQNRSRFSQCQEGYVRTRREEREGY